MRALGDIERRLEAAIGGADDAPGAAELLRLGEEVLEHWVSARGETPTGTTREGFRLLALHRQGAAGDPSFNACRETCRELAYHYNLLTLDEPPADAAKTARMMALIANHLCLFVSGKLAERSVGDFCCSAKPGQLELDRALEDNDA